MSADYRAEFGHWYDPMTRRARYCDWINDHGQPCHFRASVKVRDRDETVRMCKRHARASGYIQ